jgi:hypothetical protein
MTTMMPIRLVLLFGFVWTLAVAAATPSREWQARQKIALQCQNDLWVCSSPSRSSKESSQQQPQVLQKAPCAQHNVPFITFHRNSLLRDFDDFIDAGDIFSSPWYEMSEFAPRPHLRGSVHVMTYSIQTTTHSSVMVTTSGWVVSSPTLAEPSSDSNVMSQRRRLQETLPHDVSSEAEPPHVITEEELLCLKHYVLDNRVGGSSGCLAAMEEWQSLPQEAMPATSAVAEVVQTTTTSHNMELLQKQQLHCIFFAMNMLCVLALWILSGLLCASCLEEEEEEVDLRTDDASVEENESDKSSWRTVLSVPNDDDDPMVYIGVPLRIV